MNKPTIPATPYADSRIISTRIDPQTHKALRELAASKDCRVATVIKVAVDTYLKDKAPRIRRAAGALKDQG